MSRYAHLALKPVMSRPPQKWLAYHTKVPINDCVMLISRLVSHTHTHTIDVIVDVRMTSRDVIVGIRMTSLPVYGHTECDTRMVKRQLNYDLEKFNMWWFTPHCAV